MFDPALTPWSHIPQDAHPNSIRCEQKMLEVFKEKSFSGPEGKELHLRATGKFYTPDVIADELIDQIVSLLDFDAQKKTLKIIDPFCGDGRLVVRLIQRLARHRHRFVWDITLWDCDEAAVAAAADSVAAAAREVGCKATITAQAGDTFLRAQSKFGHYDVVVTNPPWETLKPDRRELAFLSPTRKSAYEKELRARADLLAVWFPLSQPLKKFSGWGANLARIGTELALRLCHHDHGICGIVSPASLLGDQVSGPLREWLFTKFHVKRISFFPAEGRFFEGVDQPVLALTMRVGERNRNSFFKIFDRHGVATGERKLDVSVSTLRANQFTIPIQFGVGAMDLLSGFHGLPSFGSLEGQGESDLWAGRELDETGRARYLTAKGEVRFAKGQMVSRYATSPSPKLFINRDAIKVPTSSFHTRIGWRDVSRPNQKRRMQASVIPKNWAAGNSLHVAYFRDDDQDRLFALLTVLNSCVFEFQVRARLATAHVSLGVVRRGHLPELGATRLVKSLSSLARRCMDGDEGSQTKVEVAIAKAYGLNRNSFGRILDIFPKLSSEEKELMLSPNLWS